ncbi:MAG: Fic family protein [Candidatus Aegiribacteria sp.]|nr:Fic family protein [Candidatus Aegiribacteria sp.]
MHSLLRSFVGSLSFSSDHLTTIKKLGEFKGKQELYSKQIPEVLERLRENAIIESVTASNRIEGITAPETRIKAIARNPEKGHNHNEQAIAGYRDALNLIHSSHQGMTFDCNAILQLHSMIYRYLPEDGGHWKYVDNVIEERNLDGDLIKVKFKPVSHLETPEAMRSLEQGYLTQTERYRTEPLILIPLSILDFLCIHPFDDGNGRIARLLSLLLLYKSGFEVGRYISLERIIDESLKSYYDTLEASSINWHANMHDPFPWITYFWGVLIRAYKELEDRVGTSQPSRGSKTARVTEAIMHFPGEFSISDLERKCPTVSRDMIRVVLRQLKEENIISVQRRGRASKWTVINRGDLNADR